MSEPTELEDLWRRRNDEQLVDAFLYLSEYSGEGQRIIRAEFVRRHLPEPVRKTLSLDQIETVARLQRRLIGLIAAQWLLPLAIVMINILSPSVIALIPALLCLCLWVAAGRALPATARQLLACLEVDSPGQIAGLMGIPLVNLLTLVGWRSLTDRWGRAHGVNVGWLGPTPQSVKQLRRASRQGGL
jgi:hypothetical protein